jgi:glutamine synthetase
VCESVSSQLLKKVLKDVNDKLDAKVYCGPEFEFYNFRESADSLKAKNYTQLQPLTHGMFGYSALRTGQNQEFFNAIFDELK